MAAPVSTADAILAQLERRASATGPQLAAHLGISRQAVNVHLRRLIDAGQIVKTGTTRAARYFPASAAPEPAVFAARLTLAGLDEAGVYERVAATLNLRRRLRPNVESIVHYAFTEMLNNAIDHSRAARCRVEVRLEAGRLTFEIRETGIGVFRSIAEKFRLADETAAMIELLKGRTTTQPEAHSGEGIFFTSRVADCMRLRSHRIELEWNRARDDVFVSAPRFSQGTRVGFEIRRDSRTRLERVFAEFAPAAYDFRFEKTRVRVKLLQSEYVSRSEAKRLVLNLEKFSEVEVDLRGVGRLGQGFADEVFRVFGAAHPGTRIRAVNAGDAVAAMIRHAGGTTG